MTAEDFIDVLPPLFLSETEKLALVSRVQSGDSEAETLLLRAFSPMIVRMALRNRVTGVDLADLLQAGCLGLIHSARRYDAVKGSLGTYAHHCIFGLIQEERKRSSVISRPKTYWDDRDALLSRCNAVQRAALQRPVSIDFKSRAHKSLAEFIADPRRSGADDRRELVLLAKRSLRKREREVIDLKSEGLTLREIGERIGVCRARVLQIRAQAVERMKKAIAEMGDERD